jgi:hypothetical protein
MTTFSWPLQQALHAALLADPTVGAMTGGRIHDEIPTGGLPDLAIVIGAETVAPWSTVTERGAEHRLTVEVIGHLPGFGPLKQLAGAVCDVLLGPLALSRGRVVNASFLGARTRREAGERQRRIEMTFRVVVEDDAPTHGG